MGYAVRLLKKTPVLRRAVGVASLMVAGLPAFAQEGELPTRVPEKGLAVIDCAPEAPAPEDSCVLRVPSGHTLADLSTRELGEQEASFRILRSQGAMPDGVTSSSTMILIDLSRGPGNGRLTSWNRERDQILRLIDALPTSGEVAVYGFGADLRQLAGFSRDRQNASDAVRALRPSENNTILSSNISAAITVLAGREQSLLKNLIILSDGDEEGVGTFGEINDAAAEAGVTLSAIGMFWRAEGNAATSRGLDVLSRITKPQNGLTQPVFLRNAETAQGSIDSFADRFSQSIAKSGLIVPKGTPAAARITVDLNVPVLGQPGRTTTETYKARFTPAAGDAPSPDQPEPATEEDLLFGYPALYVYIAIGALALLLLLGLIMALRGGGQEPEEEPDDPIDEPIETPDRGSEPTNLDPTPTPRPVAASAYLVRIDSGERLAIRGDQVSVGRSSSNGVVLPDQGVSRTHAELRRNREGGFSVTDMDSLNGTFVNDRKISGATALKIGDTISFAKVQVRLTLP